MDKETKKRIFSRPVITAIVTSVFAIAGALGYKVLPEDQQQAVITTIVNLLSIIPM